MTWTIDSSGTQTATIGTEHSLATPSTNATYVFKVDAKNLANGDVLELRVYDTVLNAGPLGVVWKGTYAHVQAQPIKVSPPLAASQSTKFSLKQTAGTGRGFDWSVLRL